LALVAEPSRFGRLAAVSADEPARVRAMLGAIGQQMGVSVDLLSDLRAYINPLSRFDFGRLRALKYAREWQAR
jgi:hypothetical protein